MPVITEISVQKKDKNRASIFLDGVFFCGIELVTVMENRLTPGTEIEAERLSEIAAESERAEAARAALEYAAKYVKSEREIVNKLYQKGYSRAVIEYAVGRTKEYGYIDDAAFAKGYVAAHAGKYGTDKLKYDLRARGITDADITAAFEGSGAGGAAEAEVCRAIAEKYMRGKECTPENRQKLLRYLQGRGFFGDSLYGAVRAYFENNEEENIIE